MRPTGLLQDLRISVSTAAELGARREQAVQAVAQRVVGLGAQRA